MKNASQTMYRLGRIINYVLLGLGALLTLIGIIGLIAGTEGAAGLLGYGLMLVITNVVALILAGKALASLTDGQVNNKPHIIMIVVGAISENPLFVLGGIFGLIAEHQGN